MSKDPSLHPPTSTRTPCRRLTVYLALNWWCTGFLLSRFSGCDATQASLRTTAFTLSCLAGWGVFLLVRSPSLPLFAGAVLVCGYVPMLNPTRTPWPFSHMLGVGVASSVIAALSAGLVSRLLPYGRKRPRTSTAHPLSDPELDHRDGGASEATA